MKGEKVVIVGNSGTGKSTLIKTILALNDYKGKLFYSFEDKEENLGVILQDMTLYQGSVLENLCGTDEVDKVDLKKLNDILYDTNSDKIVNELPKKLLSRMYRAAKNLSGGQIQKLLLAKSLFGNKKVVIWDEAFSSIDNTSRKHIYKHILKNNNYKETTMIISSHHLDILEFADRVIFFDGKNVCIDSHKKLLGENYSYKNFVENSI